MRTLAASARVNQAFYDIAIPKLYETITVTATNQEHLVYDLATKGKGTAQGMSGLIKSRRY
jgi:hypothetical protein